MRSSKNVKGTAAAGRTSSSSNATDRGVTRTMETTLSTPISRMNDVKDNIMTSSSPSRHKLVVSSSSASLNNQRYHRQMSDSATAIPGAIRRVASATPLSIRTDTRLPERAMLRRYRHVYAGQGGWYGVHCFQYLTPQATKNCSRCGRGPESTAAAEGKELDAGRCCRSRQTCAATSSERRKNKSRHSTPLSSANSNRISRQKIEISRSKKCEITLPTLPLPLTEKTSKNADSSLLPDIDDNNNNAKEPSSESESAENDHLKRCEHQPICEGTNHLQLQQLTSSYPVDVNSHTELPSSGIIIDDDETNDLVNAESNQQDEDCREEVNETERQTVIHDGEEGQTKNNEEIYENSSRLTLDFDDLRSNDLSNLSSNSFNSSFSSSRSTTRTSSSLSCNRPTEDAVSATLRMMSPEGRQALYETRLESARTAVERLDIRLESHHHHLQRHQQQLRDRNSSNCQAEFDRFDERGVVSAAVKQNDGADDVSQAFAKCYQWLDKRL